MIMMMMILAGQVQLLHRHTLGQVARLVDVAAAGDGDVIGQKLEGHDAQRGGKAVEGPGNVNDIVDLSGQLGVAFGGNCDHGALAGFDFLDVALSFLVHQIDRGYENAWRFRIDERNGPVLHFRSRVTFSVNVGDFLELKGAFERNWEAVLPSEKKEVLRI